MIMEHCAPRQRLKREGWVEPQFQHQRYYRDRQPQLENLGAYIRKMTRSAAESGINETANILSDGTVGIMAKDLSQTAVPMYIR
jgi:hypothetical protein